MTLSLRRSFVASKRKRRTLLSREEIVAAAAAILERDGYAALNMRSIAADLDVQAAALYRYIESREELDGLIFDHLMADCAPAIGGVDWRADLRTVSSAWRSRLLERRDATRIAFSLIQIGPNLAPLIELTLSTLRRSGMDDTVVIEAYETCVLFVHGFATSEATQRSLATTRDVAEVRYPPLRPEWASAYPTLLALAGQLMVPTDYDAQFKFGLDALIAGIERHAGGRAAAKTSVPAPRPSD